MYICLSDLLQAERVFAAVRQLEPYHLEGLEFYSTTLWHLQKEVQLSALAHELAQLDKHSPEVNSQNS